MLEALNDSFRRFADFKGRSNKLQYNSFLLFYIFIDLFINIVNSKSVSMNNFIMLFLTFPLIAVEIRRSHDVGKSGWWILVPFYSVYLMFKPTLPQEPIDNCSL